MKMEAKVTVTDKVITETNMNDPLYRDVSWLLWESIGQKVLNFAALREKDLGDGVHEYSISIDVEDLNNV